MNGIKILENKRDAMVIDKETAIAEIEKLNRFVSHCNHIIDEYTTVINLERSKQLPVTKVSYKPISDSRTFGFKELDTQTIPADECTTPLNDMVYGRRGQQLTIRAPNRRILNTTWDDIVSFYENLPTKTSFQNITGLHKKKRYVLMKFYQEHVNFPCRVVHDPTTNGKMLIKEGVTVNTDTQAMQKAIDVM